MRDVVFVSKAGREAVEKWMLDNGVSGRRMAADMGFNPVYLSHILNRRRGLSAAFCRAVHHYTRGAVTCDMLIMGTPARPQESREMEG